MLQNNKASKQLAATLMLGAMFTALQAFEYSVTSFTVRDSVYGSIFFISTGFHGTHVIIGTMFLGTSYARILAGHFTSRYHVGFELAL